MNEKNEAVIVEFLEELAISDSEESRKIADVLFRLCIENRKLRNEVQQLKNMMVNGGMPAFVCLKERPKGMHKGCKDGVV